MNDNRLELECHGGIETPLWNWNLLAVSKTTTFKAFTSYLCGIETSNALHEWSP